jgi:hypothetical protein
MKTTRILTPLALVKMLALTACGGGTTVTLSGNSPSGDTASPLPSTGTNSPTPPSDSTPPSPPAQSGSVAVGDVIQFGGYDWRVLDVRDGKALIITDKVIGVRAYNVEYKPITWADCTLRAWLNGGFYDSFNAADKARIAETRNANKDNEWYYPMLAAGNMPEALQDDWDVKYLPKGGADTTDKVFLLSLEEVVRYFGDSGQLANPPEGVATWDIWRIDDQYNDARIAYESDGNASWWWLRSPGDNSCDAAAVYGDGWVGVTGLDVDFNDGVRPALWLNL